MPLPSRRVALATSAHLAHLIPDDHLAVRALEERGITGEPAVWSDTSVRWEAFDAVVIRTCWGYHHRVDEFLAWIARLEDAGVAFFNPAAVVRWNADKRYLADLERRGVPVIHTHWVEAGERISLRKVLEGNGWDDAVMKPAVSAGAHETWRVRGWSPVDEERFGGLLASGAVLVQPFVPAIATHGEWSVMFFGDEYSHAVVKRPAPGDFRVQEVHGGSHEPCDAPAVVRDAARRVLDHAPGPRLYARVDGCVVNGGFRLMELELIEPQLFFGSDADAPGHFAAAVATVLQRATRR